jgi:hypothetical protein
VSTFWFPLHFIVRHLFPRLDNQSLIFALSMPLRGDVNFVVNKQSRRFMSAFIANGPIRTIAQGIMRLDVPSNT